MEPLMRVVEREEDASYVAPQPVRLIASLLSYILHPLFLPMFFFLWVAARFPDRFEGMSEVDLKMRLIGAFVSTTFLPGIAVFFLWRLDFVKSIRIKTQKERIIPYVLFMFFYWWMWYLSKNFKDQPEVLRFFCLGIFLTTVAGLIFNNFIKISMHAMGVGGVFIAVIISCLFYHTYLGVDLSLTFIAAGAVCSSRLLLNDHTHQEVYLGLFSGIICQLIAYFFTFVW